MKYESLIEKLKTVDNDTSSEAIEAIKSLNEEIEKVSRSKYQVIEEKRTASKKANELENAFNLLLSEFGDVEGETPTNKISNLNKTVKELKTQLETVSKEKEQYNSQLSSLQKSQQIRELADSISANHKVLLALADKMVITKDGDDYKLGSDKESLKTVDELLDSDWEDFKPSLFVSNKIPSAPPKNKIPSAPPKRGNIDPFENLAMNLINKKYPGVKKDA